MRCANLSLLAYRSASTQARLFQAWRLLPKAAVRLVTSNGLDVDDRNELQATAYEAELHRVTALNAQARQLHATFDQKYAAALEAQDLIEIYLADMALKWRDAGATLFREFEQAKKSYEEDCQRATQPIRAVHGRYRQRTQDGVRGHFELALCKPVSTCPGGLSLGSTL